MGDLAWMIYWEAQSALQCTPYGKINEDLFIYCLIKAYACHMYGGYEQYRVCMCVWMWHYVWVSVSRGGSVCFSSSYDSGEETLIVQATFYPFQFSLWLFSHKAQMFCTLPEHCGSSLVTIHMSNVIPCPSMLAYVHIAYVNVQYTQREEETTCVIS